VSHHFVVYAICAYIVGVLLLTLAMSKSKRTVNVKFFQQIYNPVQVVLCSWMAVESLRLSYFNGYGFVNNKFDVHKVDVARVFWVFFSSKILDFFDTLFIILGRKWQQLTFLHLYHHASIFYICWIGVNIGYDGDCYMTIFMNSCVHVVMYFYYLLTSVGVYVWWKQLLTYGQMLQFVVMITQSLITLQSDGSDLVFPRGVTMMYMLYIISMLVLFCRFALRTYWCKGAKPAEEGVRQHNGEENGDKGTTSKKHD